MLNKRMEFILEELEEKNSIRVTDISRLLECSEVTVRNDIQKLEEMGLLNRVHGELRRQVPAWLCFTIRKR